MRRNLKFADVCRQLDIQPYVLRYWESEFSQLGKQGESAQRTYTPEDLALLRQIKRLLYEEGYTIAGARKKLAQEAVNVEPPGPLFKHSAEGRSNAGGTEPVLDSPREERIEQLERGLREVVREARKLLDGLEKEFRPGPRGSGRGAAW